METINRFKKEKFKKVAILQSNYIPWKGYFDIISSVDEFIIYDEVQYTKNDWRNRNKIKTPFGVEWITIPIINKFGQSIRDVKAVGTIWKSKHWKTIVSNYKKTKHFPNISEWLEPIYHEKLGDSLNEINCVFIKSICDYLEINTKISYSWDYPSSGNKTERLLDICVQAGCNEYVSGPSAKSYLDEEIFTKNMINVSYFNYVGYREYPQKWGEFRHDVSILDLLFNCGRESYLYMKSSL
jgi:hypothetical protein